MICMNHKFLYLEITKCLRFVLVLFFVMLLVFVKAIYPEYRGVVVSLGITILSGAGILTGDMYLKIFIENKKFILILNWIFFVFGIFSTILFLTIWKGTLD